MLFQLHWQNPADIDKTEFVAQDSADSEADLPAMIGRLESVGVRHQTECPPGWVPLICTEDSPYFERAASPVGV